MWQQWSVNVVKNPVLLPFSYTRRYFDANLIAKVHQPKRLEVTAHLIGFACDWNRKVRGAQHFFRQSKSMLQT
jgi:hypothetical protein